MKAVTDESASVKLKLAASHVDGANSSWSAQSIAIGASKVDDDVSKALMKMSEEATGATKWKVSIIEMELKDALKRGSTQIEMEPQAAILRIRA